MKISGYHCTECQNNQFMGKSGDWVCSQCLTPIPQSFLAHMEFDHNTLIIRVGTKDLAMHRNR